MSIIQTPPSTLQDPGALAGNTPVWQMETGAAKGTAARATVDQMVRAFSDPGFAALSGTNRELSAAMRAATTGGATEAELGRFDAALRHVPGALEAFEAALYSVAPHLLQEQR